MCVKPALLVSFLPYRGYECVFYFAWRLILGMCVLEMLWQCSFEQPKPLSRSQAVIESGVLEVSKRKDVRLYYGTKSDGGQWLSLVCLVMQSPDALNLLTSLNIAKKDWIEQVP